MFAPNTRQQKKHGFTLLELLVVISIIGILIAIGAASFSVAQRQGRDARRRADMKSIQNVMEQYYVSNNSSYAGGCSSAAGVVTANGTTFVDPVNVAPKQYTCVSAAGSYTATAVLDSGPTITVTQLQ